MKIVRKPNRAEGGITDAERASMKEISNTWIKRAMRTDPIDKEKITDAINRLYAAANLKAPRVVIVSSPWVMAFAGGFASAIWWMRKNPNNPFTYAATRDATGDATDAATRAATDAATFAATFDATDDATYDATYAATRAATFAATGAATDAATRAATFDATDDATYDATDAATDAATRDATDAATRDATFAATRAATYDATVKLMLQCAQNWHRPYQGGNMWAGWCAYAQAMRDVLHLKLPVFEKYQAWEDAAIEGGFRWMHDEFCVVSDFPEILKIDDQNRPHCDDGPSHRWRDGWELYFWHGVRVTRQIIVSPETISIDQIRKEENAEVRRVMIERMGWDRFCEIAKLEIIHTDELVSNFPSLPISETVHADMRAVTSYRKGREIAQLLQSTEFRDFEDRPLKFVRITDPSTGEKYTLRVWPENTRAYEAVAQTFGMTEEQYKSTVYSHS